MLVFASTANAQDIHFSQFYETSILRNPSLTGIFTGDYKVGVQYRQQWSSISKPYQTALLSAETRMPIGGEVNDFVSFGLLSYYDKAGSIGLQTIGLYPAVNYNKALEDQHNSFLSVGFTGGYIQRNYDPSKITVDEQYQNGRFDPSLPTGEQFGNPKFSEWDVGAGISFNSSAGASNNINYIIGAAGYHFSTPRYSFGEGDDRVDLAMRWNLNAGANVKVSEKYSYQLHGNYSRQGTYNEVIAGALISWTNEEAISKYDAAFTLSGGLLYRYADAIIPVVRAKYGTFSMGASYDVTLSKLNAANSLRGGFELSIFKTGMFKDPKYEQNRTLCPHFY